MANALEEHAHELAAFIVEPMCQGTGDMQIYSANYLKRCAKYREKQEVLLIVYEIAMGSRKTGRIFAHQHARLKPDIVCVGKGLANGYLPMSATIVKNRIYETFTDPEVVRLRSYLRRQSYLRGARAESLGGLSA